MTRDDAIAAMRGVSKPGGLGDPIWFIDICVALGILKLDDTPTAKKTPTDKGGAS